MGKFAEKLSRALDEASDDGAVLRSPPESHQFLVRLLKLRHENYPGRDACGVFPLVVTGHAAMSEDSWRDWVREHAVAHYGPAYADKLVETGVDIKEMLPTAPFGRSMRTESPDEDTGVGVQSPVRYLDLNRMVRVLEMAEKWPSLYNHIAEHMAEQEFTLSAFLDRVESLPTPAEYGLGRYSTLGDLLNDGAILVRW